MRTLIPVFALSGMACFLFVAWGVFTTAGRAKFDAMDSLYPIFAGVGGVVFILLAAACWWIVGMADAFRH